MNNLNEIHPLFQKIKNDFHLIIENIPENIMEKLELNSLTCYNSIKPEKQYLDNVKHVNITEEKCPSLFATFQHTNEDNDNGSQVNRVGDISSRKEFQGIIDKQKEEIEELQSYIKDLESQLESRQLKVTQLVKDGYKTVEKGGDSFERIECRLNIKNNEENRLQKNDEYENIQVYEEKLKVKNMEIMERRTDMIKLENQIEALEKANNEMERKLKEANDHLGSVKEEQNEVNIKNCELSTKCEALKEELESMEERMKEYNLAINNKDEEIIELQTELEGYQRNMNEIEKQQSDFTKITNENRNIRKKVKYLKIDLLENEKELENNEAIITKLKKELKDTKKNCANNEGEEYLEEIEDLKKKLFQKSNEKETLSTEFEDLTRDYETKVKELKEIKKETAKIKMELTELKENFKISEKQSKDVNNKLKEEQKQMQEIKEEIEKYKKKSFEDIRGINALKHELDKEKRENEQMEIKIQNYSANIENLHQEKEIKEKEINKLKKELENIRRDHINQNREPTYQIYKSEEPKWWEKHKQ